MNYRPAYRAMVKNNPGPKRNPARDYYARLLKLNENQRKQLTDRVLEQLEACKDEEARRIIMGVSGEEA